MAVATLARCKVDARTANIAAARIAAVIQQDMAGCDDMVMTGIKKRRETFVIKPQ
jgi:hypothetical protein